MIREAGGCCGVVAGTGLKSRLAGTNTMEDDVSEERPTGIHRIEPYNRLAVSPYKHTTAEPRNRQHNKQRRPSFVFPSPHNPVPRTKTNLDACITGNTSAADAKEEALDLKVGPLPKRQHASHKLFTHHGPSHPDISGFNKDCRKSGTPDPEAPSAPPSVPRIKIE